MLIIALIASSILLLVANVAAYSGKKPLAVCVCGLVLSLATMLVACILPPLFYQAVGFVLVSLAWAYFGWKPRAFLAFSVGVTVLIYGFQSWFAWREMTRMQEQFPMVSLEDRLPAREVLPVNLSPASEKRLDELESDERRESTGFRERSLRQLHANTVAVFINRPGFGITRASGMREEWLRRGLLDEAPVKQPGGRLFIQLSPDLLQKLEGAGSHDVLAERMHQENLLAFANPVGYGYVKDRAHVAGFQGHGFRNAGADEAGWKLQTLDLLGAVVHDQPVVYLSDNLPRMDELREAKIRALDEFEDVGFKKLQGGEDFFIGQTREGRRMLGSIRSTKQCLSCHDGPRGTLLGAFSYTLTPAR